MTTALVVLAAAVVTAWAVISTAVLILLRRWLSEDRNHHLDDATDEHNRQVAYTRRTGANLFPDRNKI